MQCMPWSSIGFATEKMHVLILDIFVTPTTEKIASYLPDFYILDTSVAKIFILS